MESTMSSPIAPVASIPRPHADPIAVSESVRGKFAERLEELERTEAKEELGPPMLKKLMRQMEVSQASLDGLVSAASSGKNFSNAELLGLQAAMYRYSIEIDLLSKVIQGLVQCLRDLLKMQV